MFEILADNAIADFCSIYFLDNRIPTYFDNLLCFLINIQITFRMIINENQYYIS